MSILSSVTSILEPIKSPGIVPPDDCKPDDCGDGKQSRSNDDHRGDDHGKSGDNDYGGWKDGKNDDHQQHQDDCQPQKANYDHKGDDHKGNDHRGDDHKGDDHKGDDYGKGGDNDHGGWKDAKNDDCQPHNDDCQPHKDYCQPQNCDPKPSDDCGKGDNSHNPGDALAKFDFSHGDFGSNGPDHSGDMQAALASMSSDHALDYAIGQMGPADHFDVGHFDVPTDTSHDAAHHA
jgi:hypothetical protein